MKYKEPDTLYLQKIGTTIKTLREEHGWSQEQFSFKSGLHRTYIGSIERGERNISVLNLKKIANTLEVPITKLFDFEI
ncbi:helix-turn-helix transcriptional regulator [Paenibacillus barcinonensis]|uniref:DNA-binding XRE family transcriptional regulator n=1 Tax=Paenibacillus barcinonensis TaxID=198119 RepID=A0A2V4VUZ1_PAEBA|nr:helix-turn-helix transcriptional regulator [Paenibacillus barcinonensis]PYE42685.1 DNA-binding XRE family transcriptional regulator [Paenibacillus barcinonensis]QKS58875.1 helix-turn-helix transcriptional regulator [Paenibacillus barcinonensis]